MVPNRMARVLPASLVLLLLAWTHAPAQTLDWRYTGGGGDGHALPIVSAFDLAGNGQLARFAGGGGDGYALFAADASDLASNGTLARYGGGMQDGSAMLATDPSDLSNNTQLARYKGGADDGAEMLAPGASDFANNPQLARSTGGGGDGHDVLGSAPLDLSNGNQLARMRGGSGDGHALALASPADLAGRGQLAKFAGGGEDGHALLESNPVDLANGGQLARVRGGGGDGNALHVSALLDLAGHAILARFSGGDGDGHGTDRYQPNNGNVPAVLAAAFLQGPYTSSAMSTGLNSGSWLPLAQPYNTTPWNYIGTDSVTAIPSSSIVDWVLLELRAGTAANTLAEQRAAFIKSDGSIVATDGVSEVTFPHTAAGDYYLVVRHRNHLAVMSDTTFSFGALNAPVIDFRFSQSAAYGTDPMKALSGGLFGLYAGDGTGNGAITISDRNAVWRTQNGTSGYRSGDYNMSGSVTITDRNSAWRPNNGLSTAVP